MLNYCGNTAVNLLGFLMQISLRPRAVFSAVLVQLVALASFAQTPPPAEFSKSQLETEQRIVKANIADANYHVDRAIKSVAANLPDVAKVSLLRATGRIAQTDEVLKAHPERIERLSFSLLYSRENVRKELRASFNKLRDEFGAVEDAMYALRRDMLHKGIFGEDLKQQVAVLDAASKLLPEIEKKDPALATKVRGLIEQINDALASGDTAKAEKLIGELNSLLEKAGYQSDVKSAKDRIGGGAASAGVTPSADGVNFTTASGQTAAVAGATSLGGNKVRLADGTEVDVTGAQILPDGSIRLADGRIVRDGKIVSPNSPPAAPAASMAPAAPATPAKGSVLVDADGNELSDEFVWENGEGKGVDKVYVGGKGARLVKETKVTVRATPSASKTNTYEVTKVPGEARTWALVVAPVAGTEKQTGGSHTVSISLSDKSGATGFTVNKWEITSPAGSPSLDSTTATQVTATFNASATYTVVASGVTDWGSPFQIKGNLKIGVE